MADHLPIELVREPMGSRRTILLPRLASLNSGFVTSPTFIGLVAAAFPDLMGVESVQPVPYYAETVEDLKNLGGVLLIRPPPGDIDYEAFLGLDQEAKMSHLFRTLDGHRQELDSQRFRIDGLQKTVDNLTPYGLIVQRIVSNLALRKAQELGDPVSKVTVGAKANFLRHSEHLSQRTREYFQKAFSGTRPVDVEFKDAAHTISVKTAARNILRLNDPERVEAFQELLEFITGTDIDELEALGMGCISDL